MRFPAGILSSLSAFATLLAPPLAAQTRTVYAPVVSVTRPDTSLPRLQSKGLLTRLDFFNASPVGHSVTVSTRWGPCGQAGFVTDPLFAPPGGVVFFGTPQTFDCPGDYVGVVAVPVAAGVVVSSALQRILTFSCDATCPGSGPGTSSISTGEIRLPIFEDLVPPGREAVSGSVALFNEAAYPACGLDVRLYPRRVNFTVLNAGAATAMVTLRATAGAGDLLDQTYHVAPKSVIQFNGLSLGDSQLCRADGQPAASRVVFRAIVDQPSVAWVSTTFDADLPDSIRYGFFPLNPVDTTPVTLANGRWTGGGACLSASDTGCDMAVGCGHGQFPKPALRGDGTFDVEGSYRIEAGPVSIDPPPPARFFGSVSGTTLTVTVVPSGALPSATYTMSPGTPGGCPVPCV